MAVGVKTMEIKKTQERTEGSSAAASVPTKKSQSFLAGIKSEFMKITWTDKEELRTYTKIVVGATFFCGMGVYFMDLLIRTMLSGIDYFLRLIFG